MDSKRVQTVLEVIEESRISTTNTVTFLKLEEKYLQNRMIIENNATLGHRLGETQAKIRLNQHWLDFLKRQHDEEIEKLSGVGGGGNNNTYEYVAKN